MVDHQEILGVVAIIWQGSRPADFQKLDGQAARGSLAVFGKCLQRVRKPHDGAEDATWLAQYSMRRSDGTSSATRNSAVDTSRGFGMLGPS